jgi:hypothetical protein
VPTVVLTHKLKITTSTNSVISIRRSPGAGMLVFDGITEWVESDSALDDGTVEFASRAVNWINDHLTGFRFACAEGREEKRDAQRVLGKLAEVARLESPRRPEGATAWTRIEKRFLIWGKLEANYSTAIVSP